MPSTIKTPIPLRSRRPPLTRAVTNEFVGSIAVQDDPLLAVEHPAGAVARGSRIDVVKIIPRMPFRVREGDGEAAVGDFRDQLGALFGGPAVPQKAAAQNHGCEERLQRQGPAECFHRDHCLHGTAGRAPVALLEGQPEQPDLGVLCPQLPAPPFGALPVSLALLEGVAVADQPVETLLQQPLLFAKVEIHRLGLLPRVAGAHPLGD